MDAVKPFALVSTYLSKHSYLFSFPLLISCQGHLPALTIAANSHGSFSCRMLLIVCCRIDESEGVVLVAFRKFDQPKRERYHSPCKLRHIEGRFGCGIRCFEIISRCEQILGRCSCVSKGGEKDECSGWSRLHLASYADLDLHIEFRDTTPCRGVRDRYLYLWRSCTYLSVKDGVMLDFSHTKRHVLRLMDAQSQIQVAIL